MSLPTVSEEEPLRRQVAVDGDHSERKKTHPLQLAVRRLFVESGALRTFMINFLLCYNVRFGMALLGRVFTLLRTSPKSLLDIDAILSEKHLNFRTEAVRIGMFVASFSGIYVSMKRYLRGDVALFKSPPPLANHQEEESSSSSKEWYHPLIAGTCAGVSLYWMDPSWHRTLALYAATRAGQCYYNFAKARGYFHFWGSSWDHGDSLLFAVSSAQIMYSYVMRPSSLPPSFYAFIRKQGPLPEVVLQSVRDSCRGQTVNTKELFQYVEERGGKEALKQVTDNFRPDRIPTRALHAGQVRAIGSAAYAFTNVAKQIFGVYLSLALVPQVVLRFQKFIKTPGDTVFKSLLSAMWSTLFLSTFCGSYQLFVVCFLRPMQVSMGWADNKLWYYIAGYFASLAILIEQKSRRSELALYTFPRGADALYKVLYDRELVVSLPHGELLLFMVSMGVITFFYEHDPTTLSPLVKSVMSRFIPEQVLNPLKPPKRNRSQMELGELRSDSPNMEASAAGEQPQHMISLGGSTLVS